MPKDFYLIHEALKTTVKILSPCVFSMERIQNKKIIKGFNLLQQTLIESFETIKRENNTQEGIKKYFGDSYEELRKRIGVPKER